MSEVTPDTVWSFRHSGIRRDSFEENTTEGGFVVRRLLGGCGYARTGPGLHVGSGHGIGGLTLKVVQ